MREFNVKLITCRILDKSSVLGFDTVRFWAAANVFHLSPVQHNHDEDRLTLNVLQEQQEREAGQSHRDDAGALVLLEFENLLRIRFSSQASQHKDETWVEESGDHDVAVEGLQNSTWRHRVQAHTAQQKLVRKDVMEVGSLTVAVNYGTAESVLDMSAHCTIGAHDGRAVWKLVDNSTPNSPTGDVGVDQEVVDDEVRIWEGVFSLQLDDFMAVGVQEIQTVVAVGFPPCLDPEWNPFQMISNFVVADFQVFVVIHRIWG